MRKMFLLLMSATMLLVTSCSKDENLTEESEGLELAQIEMTYEQILKGYTPEEIAAPKDEKTPSFEKETEADEDLRVLLQEAVDKSYSKTRNNNIIVGSDNTPAFGVFKVNTCGNYPELRVFMDCEDGNDTHITGNLPGSTIDRNKNITLGFCIIQQKDHTLCVPKGYGYLYFVGAKRSVQNNGLGFEVMPDVYLYGMIKGGGMEFVERYHDNEDKSNKNSVSTTGLSKEELDEIKDLYPESEYTPKPSYVGETNTLLTWAYAINEPYHVFKPGFAYGVLPAQHNKDHDVEIYINDENKKNSNYANLVVWNGKKYERVRLLNKYETYGGIVNSENTSYHVKIINP